MFWKNVVFNDLKMKENFESFRNNECLNLNRSTGVFYVKFKSW